VWVLISNTWVPGKVTDQRDGKYTVRTDDGSTVVGVEGNDIRPQKEK